MKTEQEIDLYPQRKKEFEAKRKEIENKCNETNKKLLFDFGNHLLSIGNIKYTIAKRWRTLILIDQMLQQSFLEANIFDWRATIAQINSLELSEASKAIHRRYLKQFFNWYEDYDNRLITSDIQQRTEVIRIYKFFKKDVSSSYKKPKIDPSEVINDDDVSQILENGCSNNRERALFSLLHESGMRVGELLRIRIKNIVFNSDGTASIFIPDGKTGERGPFLFVDCVPYLRRYLDFHINKEDPRALFWYSLKKTTNGVPDHMSYPAVRKILQKIFKRAGINKKCNAHWFRHSRTSLDISKYTDSITCKKMGWVIGSKQIATYSHLNNKPVNDAIRLQKGLTSEEEVEKSKKCSCGYYIQPKIKYCSNCGRPRDVQVALTEQQKVKEATEMLMKKWVEVMGDSKERDLFELFKKSK
ncbi:tyrosine-type recombinase/integrase [Candidatus Woesearchaeota archaeon]|jgi:site-specific recombinase XerD|nr:tyrosine-type recombinase/integrase [Candidatus Woesearchaeota archaeon]